MPIIGTDVGKQEPQAWLGGRGCRHTAGPERHLQYMGREIVTCGAMVVGSGMVAGGGLV